jgi:sugar phosphate isomerase/epimerase
MICAMSLAALTVLEAGPVETIRIAAACGYTHVGLRAVAATAAERHWPMLTDRALAADICRALDDHAMGVLDVEILRLTDAIDWDGVKAAIDYAAALGAGRVLVADNDPDPARSHDNLGRMGQIAQGAGVCVALEFMPWTCAPNLAAACERVAGLDGVAMLVDAFHLARSGGTVADVAAEASAVSYLQMCDIAGPVPPMDAILQEARADRLFPGRATSIWSACCAPALMCRSALRFRQTVCVWRAWATGAGAIGHRCHASRAGHGGRIGRPWGIGPGNAICWWWVRARRACARR